MFVDKKDNPELELTSTFFSLYYFVFQYIKERCLSIFDFWFSVFDYTVSVIKNHQSKIENWKILRAQRYCFFLLRKLFLKIFSQELLGTSQYYFPKYYASFQRTAFFQKRVQRYGLFSNYQIFMWFFFDFLSVLKNIPHYFIQQKQARNLSHPLFHPSMCHGKIRSNQLFQILLLQQSPANQSELSRSIWLSEKKTSFAANIRNILEFTHQMLPQTEN